MCFAIVVARVLETRRLSRVALHVRTPWLLTRVRAEQAYRELRTRGAVTAAGSRAPAQRCRVHFPGIGMMIGIMSICSNSGKRTAVLVATAAEITASIFSASLR